MPLVVTRGVPSKDEHPLAAVARSDIGRSNALPRSHVPDSGQLSEYGSEPQRPMAGHVLQHDESGS
jgi:hypothetical protein